MTGFLMPGDPAPWFAAPTLDRPRFQFDSIAGRHVVLLFLGSAGTAQAQAALAALAAQRDLFDDRSACFFGISDDPDDAAQGRIAHRMPGIRWFLDHDRSIARRFRAVDPDGRTRPHWLLCDPMLRVLGRAGIGAGPKLLDSLRALLAGPAPDLPAPVLVAPNIFDPAFCRRLIDLYERHGGSPSGFMREVDGRTVGVMDSSVKRRSDYYLDDDDVLREQVRARLSRFLVPQIERVFQFRASRIERYMIACYDSGDSGFFQAHRDNTTGGTAHRRFACTINLNAGDYEGGDLIFPEFGQRRYRAPTGGAVVFSCSLLHEATPVTRGKRYAYLPFLYDEAAARQREENARSGKVGADLATYRAEA
ncbi:peroxiredoxin [Rhizorhabdus wittichii DC-6]|uniref:Alkyl hydroperoxide reductase/ Thiol specific antioxidant/ Mal allergen n=2 Tax=Rhizorhabdus wittichii TaxID=160791 RepID=A0A9J9HEV4_RHIWR|nr:2OG-Fe(II) oxygenase [Rhizorhabdus wittichii]ABQ70319.1 alkyl hydroperoxide reductase/ Thiol specific antioxidant/ Mal allergen [Rhizorhabdus wittichii RW1]ARR52732.1 peroxiredoxin [Rhizorhabdus wittichii DC-6]QTH24134.1 2OG-Fe(II) oxygenase [Rhizorhabdus wittichii]